MTTIVPEKYLVSIDRIYNESISCITFEELISLFFHIGITIWKQLYLEFLEQLDIQNENKWPEMFTIKNHQQNCIEAYTDDKSFVCSDNIFIFLLRLIHIEKIKPNYISFPNILEHTEECGDLLTKEITVDDMIDLVYVHVKHYVKIYDGDNNLEHQLGMRILEQLEQLE